MHLTVCHFKKRWRLHHEDHKERKVFLTVGVSLATMLSVAGGSLDVMWLVHAGTATGLVSNLLWVWDIDLE